MTDVDESYLQTQHALLLDPLNSSLWILPDTQMWELQGERVRCNLSHVPSTPRVEPMDVPLSSWWM